MTKEAAKFPVRQVLRSFWDRIRGLDLTPLERTSYGWRLTVQDDDAGWSGSASWQAEEVPHQDWQTPLIAKDKQIRGWPETETLVGTIHEKTGAELAQIRGVVLHVAEALLRDSDKTDNEQLLDGLGEELVDAFTEGLPARFRSYLTGVRVSSPISPDADILLRPFLAEDWPQHLDPGYSMRQMALHRTTILEIDGRLPALGQPFDPFDPEVYHWQRRMEQVLRILRLYKVGGPVSHLTLTVPTGNLRIPLHGQGSTGPDSSSTFEYRLTDSDGESLATHFRVLADLPAWTTDNLRPVDVGLYRYESALSPGKYSEEILLYSVMGLEALFRLRHESRRSLTERVALILDLAGNANPLEVRERMDRAYKIRNRYVHGETLKQSQSDDLRRLLRTLLEYLRVAILVSLGIRLSKKRLLRTIDDALLLPETRNELKKRVGKIATRIQLQSSQGLD